MSQWNYFLGFKKFPYRTLTAAFLASVSLLHRIAPVQSALHTG